VMTFMVNHYGVVYSKDLGQDTARSLRASRSSIRTRAGRKRRTSRTSSRRTASPAGAGSGRGQPLQHVASQYAGASAS
jgi:hypothetical protein